MYVMLFSYDAYLFQVVLNYFEQIRSYGPNKRKSRRMDEHLDGDSTIVCLPSMGV